MNLRDLQFNYQENENFVFAIALIVYFNYIYWHGFLIYDTEVQLYG